MKRPHKTTFRYKQAEKEKKIGYDPDADLEFPDEEIIIGHSYFVLTEDIRDVLRQAIPFRHTAPLPLGFERQGLISSRYQPSRIPSCPGCGHVNEDCEHQQQIAWQRINRRHGNERPGDRDFRKDNIDLQRYPTLHGVDGNPLKPWKSRQNNQRSRGGEQTNSPDNRRSGSGRNRNSNRRQQQGQSQGRRALGARMHPHGGRR